MGGRALRPLSIPGDTPGHGRHEIVNFTPVMRRGSAHQPFQVVRSRVLADPNVEWH